MEHLFSYGTLRLPAVQIDIFGETVLGRPDALVGFKRSLIEIVDPAVLALSGEQFHPIVTRSDKAADRVAGIVFTVTPAQLGKADLYEVDDYERVSVTLESGVTAWLYVAKG